MSQAIDPVLLRRLLGTASLVLLLAVGTLVLDWRYSPVAGSYQVVAELGVAGSGVSNGTDVKVRGVNVGQVDRVRYEDGVAYADLTLDPQPRLPAPDELRLVVTQKTLLGEKQLELTFDDAVFEEGPFLTEGDTIVAATEPTELAQVLDTLEPLLSAVDERELAEIIDVLGDQRGEGEIIAENIELGQQLAAFADRTSGDTLARFSDLSAILERLTPAVGDLTRLNTTLPDATAILTERQADIRANLEAISRFSRTVDTFLTGVEPTLSRFLRSGEPIGAVLERNQDQIGSLVEGASLYARALGSGGLLLDDNSEYAPFQIFVDGTRSFDPVYFLCHELDDILGVELPLLCEGGH